MLFSRHALPALTAFAVTVVACGSGDVSLGSNEYEIQKTGDGRATGDGRKCSWSGDVAAPSAIDGGAASVDSGAVVVDGGAIDAGQAPGMIGQSADTPVSSDTTQYAVGDTVPSPDGCNDCRCTSQGIACTTRACAGSCTYGGKPRASGSSFPSTDGCNTCSCSGGAVSCTERACAPQVCTFAGKNYNVGDSFSDGCNGCSCGAGGLISCTTMACPVCTFEGKTYYPGDKFTSGCAGCVCGSGGIISCTPCAP